MDKHRFIVMPFQPEPEQAYSGIGLGLHFLIGNVMAIQTLLKEFWFGWRVNKLFKNQVELAEFCQGKKGLENIEQLAKEQEIKYWLNGTYVQDDNRIILSLVLSIFNGNIKEHSKKFIIDLSDNLIDFRTDFINWLGEFSLSFEDIQRKKIMWPEQLSLEGLDFLGRSVESTYMNYVDNSRPDDPIELDFFEKAALAAHNSYLAWDMKGWGLYKNRSYKEAEKAFLKAISLNKDGLGALSGLMWCYIFVNNRDLATKYAIAKADVRNASHNKAKSFVANKIKTLFE
ncbi:MAG: hypothetical protein ABFR31_01235 [Thermodesulfobacteriota bacterium]